MTTAAEGAELTRVGPGTPMGELMRQYWIPAALSSELKRDGAPVRLMLLGEKLLAFRDSAGRVGVMDHRCPHRCASLFLGRNEDGGLRCVYHGWKFDVSGNCIDMPSVPAQQDFKAKVKAKAYKAAERAGVVWVYMGAAAEAPPFPELETLLVPDEEVGASFILRSCNYLQALEGDIDTSHFGFLHAGHVEPDDVPEDHPIRHTVTIRAPEYHVSDTPWGTTYAAFRDAGKGQTYWRFANFLFPFWTQQPQGEFGEHVHARAWVPLDDDHTMFVYLWWKKGSASLARPRPPLRGGKKMAHGADNAYLPNTTDWLGRWRLVANEANDWRIDRDAQSDGVFYSGIDNIHLQDQAVTESMGPITDHDFEHLAPSDQMITRTRRRLLLAARALRDEKVPPPGAADPSVFRAARSGYFLSEQNIGWREIYARRLAEAVRPAEERRAAD
ncbi:MAG: Rieske 2Fe-2S domain-containing protein [Alphaproteobacteria bacterium]|nr:Rieske 2Fe-2S domain-containing protein [Alphaproteobacteria bacterium]